MKKVNKVVLLIIPLLLLTFGMMGVQNADALPARDQLTALVTVGDESIDLREFLTPNADQTAWIMGEHHDLVFGNGSKMTLGTLELWADPALIVAFSGIDNVGGTSFSIAVLTPLIGPEWAAGMGYKSTGRIVGGFSDGGDGTIGNSTLATTGLLGPTVNGSFVSSAGPAVPNTVVGSSGVMSYGPHSVEVNGVCPAGGCAFFDMLVSFTNQAGDAGKNDAFALTATHVIESAPIPEPSTLLMMGMGMIGLAAYRRMRS
ncbi:MAG: PEP-CTERM sorting domain-containing protein [Nitrospira sp.]|nr:PEP-CTERM sorting domain-containing protein [bacterium]MBL7048120.1 PEP-CTERM sorting domain-containing protein [Nitrospira sp.]